MKKKNKTPVTHFWRLLVIYLFMMLSLSLVVISLYYSKFKTLDEFLKGIYVYNNFPKFVLDTDKMFGVNWYTQDSTTKLIGTLSDIIKYNKYFLIGLFALNFVFGVYVIIRESYSKRIIFFGILSILVPVLFVPLLLLVLARLTKNNLIVTNDCYRAYKIYGRKNFVHFLNLAVFVGAAYAFVIIFMFTVPSILVWTVIYGSLVGLFLLLSLVQIGLTVYLSGVLNKQREKLPKIKDLAIVNWISFAIQLLGLEFVSFLIDHLCKDQLVVVANPNVATDLPAAEAGGSSQTGLNIRTAAA